MEPFFPRAVEVFSGGRTVQPHVLLGFLEEVHRRLVAKGDSLAWELQAAINIYHEAAAQGCSPAEQFESVMVPLRLAGLFPAT